MKKRSLTTGDLAAWNSTYRKDEAMKSRRAVEMVAGSILFGAMALVAVPATAQNHAEGKLEVNGKPVAITQVYAYAEEGFFDKKKQDVTVLLCDAPVPAAAVRDTFARQDLVRAGKLRCVLQVINTEKQVIHFEVMGKGFDRMQGASTEQVLEAKTFDGKTVAGRSRTKSPQKSFDDIPYSYDITFSAVIEPKK
jgi:hypothetical protein